MVRKGEIAITSNFSFSHHVFYSYIYLVRRNAVLCGNGSRAFFFSIAQPFPKQQILDSSKLKEFAEDNFKPDENGRKLSKRIENTAGKGEIAHYEQFLLFPQCFQRTCTADM